MPATPSIDGPQSDGVVLTAVLILLSAALLAPGLVVGPSLDAAVFSHVGEQLLRGVPPYLGAWDHKPPGIYIASAGARALLGWLGPWTADWLLSVAATAGIGMAVARVLARSGVTGWAQALAAVGAVVFAGQYLLALGGGLTEPLAAFVLSCALLLAVESWTRPRAVGIGALVAIGLLQSLQVLPAGLVVIGLIVLHRPPSARLRAKGFVLLGFAAPLVVVAAWLVLSGALPAALDAIVGYSAAYRSSGGDYGSILAAPVAAWTVLAGLFLIAPTLLGVMAAVKATGPRRRLTIAMLLWIGASVALFFVQGRFYAHYAIPLAIPLAILAGLGLDRARGSLARAGRATVRAVIVLPLVATLAISVVAAGVSGAMQLAPVADANVRMLAVSQRLRDLPPGTVLVWGNEPRLYDLAGRTPATAYAYLYPLTTPGYSTPALIDDVRRELTSHPPAIVIDAGSDGPGQPGFLPLLIDRPVTTDGRDLDLLDPLRAFVADRYDLASTVAGWPIYLLKQGSAP